MQKKETVTIYEEHGRAPQKRISWSAIFVGALVAVGLSFLLNIFGISIGMSAIKEAQEGSIHLAVGGTIGILIITIICMGVSGFAAGYLGRYYCPQRNLGILYGFTTWSLALLLGAIVAGQVGTYLSNYAQSIMGPNSIPFQSSTANANAFSGETIKAQIAKSSSKKEKANEAGKTAQTKMEVVHKDIANGAFLIFGLFLIGAISSCVGAHWGMQCKRMD